MPAVVQYDVQKYMMKSKQDTLRFLCKFESIWFDATGRRDLAPSDLRQQVGLTTRLARAHE